ncbi:MAG: hypothetical protein ABI415_00530 [Flavitalea sp.]
MNYDDLVKNHSGEMIEKLVTEILSKESVEARFDFEDNEQWSVVSMHIYEEDKEISLRLHTGEKYILYFGYYDDDDEFHEIIKLLTPDEIKSVPKGLLKVMQKVLSDEQGMKIPSHLLTKHA